MAALIEITKSDDNNPLFPSYINGVLKKYSLGSAGGMRYITLELYTSEDWKVVDSSKISQLINDKEESNKFVDNFIKDIRAIEL